ncbi:MAG: acetate--CoA ligase family protein [Mobilibacterium timonense]|uniref:acetate--CoA ligase family protein n=1 Tax=Mobilibacterium timonense TaxID=1871012 RepID=UPI002355BDF7|nr:acetate--CoA ligase family protein [Mobilibacterium timonense]MBM6990222.1 acetate--CoA ligase family protein [Mobilibacterium timonense]
MDLYRFLKPRTVAIVGATEKEGFAGGTCRNIMKYSRNLDNVYFVNPNRDSVFGKKCYDSLEDIEVDIDTVVIGTPKKTIPAMLYQAKDKSAAGVVVYASGYSEVRTEEAIADEQELVDICRELDLCLMGPNCCGFANYIDDKYCWAIQHPDRNRKGKVGFVSQSGQICMSLMDSPNMTFSYCISCGNSKVVSEEEYINFLVDDEDTKVVAIYMEGVGDPRKLECCFRKAALNRKPVIVLKAGKSERASAIAASHTGSMSGSDAAFDAIFKKYGIIRVDDMQELIGTSLLFADTRAFPDKRCNYAVVCLSGGETAICADEGYKIGLNYADFEEETVEKLKGLLPFYASPRNNPLDITATPAYQPEVLAETLLAVLNDKNVDMVLLGFTLMDEIVDNSFYIMFDGIKLALEKSKKPFACLNFIEMSRNADLVSRFTELGVPILPCTKYAFECLKHLDEFVTYDPSERTLNLAIPENKLNGRKALSEFDSKKMLIEGGIDIELGIVAKTPDEAVRAADQLGYPVAAKIESSEILHKSDVGGVKLGLKNEEDVRRAFSEIIDNVSANAKGAGYNGVLIQRMAEKSTELIIGVNSDPQFGPMILVGLGGIFVEVFKDAALYPAPLNKSEALEMIYSLRSQKLLTGYRGQESCDLEAIADVIVEVSDFAVRNKDRLIEMDINPLYVYPKGKKPAVIDALVIIDE